MTLLPVFVILSTILLTSAQPVPGFHIHTSSYQTAPLVHHVPVYHEPYHAYHAPLAPVVHQPVYHAPVYHEPLVHQVHPVSYKVKTHYHLFGK